MMMSGEGKRRQRQAVVLTRPGPMCPSRVPYVLHMGVPSQRGRGKAPGEWSCERYDTVRRLQGSWSGASQGFPGLTSSVFAKTCEL